MTFKVPKNLMDKCFFNYLFWPCFTKKYTFVHLKPLAGSFFGKRTLKKLEPQAKRNQTQWFVCLLLDHALTTKPRDMIFGMYTHVTHESKISYVILTLNVI